MKKFKNFMLVLLLMCFTSTAWGANYYVDQRPESGNDLNPGTITAPFATITRAMVAVFAAAEECTITIYGGGGLIYDEDVTVPAGYTVHFIGVMGVVKIGEGSTFTLNADVTLEDFAAETAGTLIQVNTGGNIQDGIDFAVTGSTVTVTAGTFAEDLTIGKAITLTGGGVATLNSFTSGGNAINITINGVNVSNFTIVSTGTGILVAPAVTSAIITENIFDGNADYGVEYAGIGTIDAEYNYWGDPTGPTHSSNPCGIGDAVTDGVDFSPWYSDAAMTETRYLFGAPTADPVPSYCSSDEKHLSDLVDYLTYDGAATITWYSDVALETEITGDPLLETGSYYATQTLWGCESPAVEVAVTVSETPDAPGGDAEQPFCSDALKTISDIVITTEPDAEIKWYDDATDGTEYTSPGTTLLLDGYTYYASQSNGCLSVTRKAVTVTVTETPGAPYSSLTAIDYCSVDGKTAEDLVTDLIVSIVPDATLVWYDSEDAVVTGTLPVGNYTLYGEQTLNDCVGTARLEVAITVTETPGAPTSTDDEISYCSDLGKTITDLETDLTVTPVDGGTIIWYDEVGNVWTATTLPVGTYTLYAEQTLNDCVGSERLAVDITVTETPGAPTATGLEVEYCSADGRTVSFLETDLSVTPVDGATIVWYDSEEAVVTGTLPVGTYTYYAEQTLNDCVGTARLAVAITVTETPGAPTSTLTEIDYCSVEGKTLADLVTDLGVEIVDDASLVWYTTLTGDVVATDPLEVGTYTLYAEQTLNDCVGSARLAVAVTVTETPDAPTAEDVSYCESEDKTIGDLTVLTGENIRWYNAATSGDEYTDLAELLGNTTYWASQTVNGCESDERTSLTVTINENPAVPTAVDETVLDVCASEELHLSDLTALVVGSDIKWYDSEDMLISGDPLLATGMYYATQTSEYGCESTTKLEMDVTVHNPAAPTADAQSFCYVNADEISDIIVEGEETATFTWYETADGSETYATDFVLVTGSYWVSQTVGGCESERTEVVITITTSDPGAPSIQDSKLMATNITANRATIGWTRGVAPNGGTGSLVVCSTSPISGYEVPAGCNDASYTFLTNFASAPYINDSDTAKIVYIGSAKTFNLTGLKKLTTYYLKVFAFKGTAPNRKYNTTIGTNTKNFRTPLRKEGAEGTDALAGTFAMGLISPNPVRDAVNFTLDVPQNEAYTIEIYDIDGRVVNTFCQDLTYSIGIHNININASTLSSGVYTLVVKTGMDMAITQFVVAK